MADFEKYQDYVIKDGELIGKFEEMYKKFENPWNQIESGKLSYTRNSTSVSLKKYNITSLLEIGCGLGETTAFLKKNNPYIKIAGCDISETAIRKAKEKYPQICFEVNTVKEVCSKKIEYQALYFAEIMWYILNDLGYIISKLSENFRGGYILVNQTFYDKGKQEYGKEYFTSVDEMIDYFPWKCLEKVVCYYEGGYDAHVVFYIEE